MGGLLGDLENFWGAVESGGAAVFHDIEDAVNHLTSLGVPLFPSLKNFIQLLVTEGENPFIFIPNLVSHIISRGGNAPSTLEELASGFLNEGPSNYTSRLTSRAINPIINTVQQHTQTAAALGTLHQSTITQIQNKLTILNQGTPGTIPFQGDAALAIQNHFTTVATNMNKLTTPMNSSSSSSSGMSDPWPTFQDNFASINQGFVDGLSAIPNMTRQFALFDLAVVGVELIIGGAVALPTVGLGDAVEVPIAVVLDAVLVLAELLTVAVWFLGDCLIWILRVLAALIVLGIEEIIYHLQAHSTAASYPQWVLPGGQTLPPARIPRAQDLWDHYKGVIGKALTASIIAYLSLYCSVSVAQQLLDNWALFGPVLEGLNAKDPGDVLSAEALINAIVLIGPLNVKTLGMRFPWKNPDGSPVINNGKAVYGDIDIVTKSNPPWFVEVGPYTKGDNAAHFVRQLTQLKQYADSQKPPARAKFYMQMPAVPMTPNQAISMGETLTIARRILEGQDIPTEVDPTTGEIIPPLTGQNVVVMGQAQSNCPIN